MPTPIDLATVFVGLLVVFRALEFTRRRDKRMPLLRPGFLTDMAYWVFTPYVTQWVTRAAVLIAILPIVLIAYGKLDSERIKNGFGPVGRLPFPLQACIMLLIADFLGYWMHRAFHGRSLWRFHAVHHASRSVDWLSSVRVHPVNDAVMRLASAVPLVALGFAPAALAVITSVLTLWAIFLHANLDWDLGPLRRVIVVTPLPPLASHGRECRAGQEFRRAVSGLGHSVRDVLHAAGPAAVVLRYIDAGAAQISRVN